ncbi:hypothetical protein [Streptomyces sp. NBC_00987]|uniref:hypothetical protein n=1 Tax=Streptomyces sp. NBC_00987 TaxID=2903703 RepID=UPI003865E456|nr:hypothetical protein OG355_33555 [Streptomyces sp. NBC_00987]
MRTITTAVVGAALLFAVVGCSSEPDDKPETKPSATASATAPADAEAAAQACTDEVYKQIKGGTELGVDQPKPDACTGMSQAEYLDTLLAVTQQLNKDARDDLQEDIEDAANQ